MKRILWQINAVAYGTSLDTILEIILKIIFFLLHQVSGVLQNTGQSLVFRVEKDSKHQVNISGGPLSYRYQFEEIYFHYGMEDNRGSEHQIDHHTFPGEVSRICEA